MESVREAAERVQEAFASLHDKIVAIAEAS